MAETGFAQGAAIAIVGAGPAGLSLAKLLSDDPKIGRLTVFEASERVGGKSLSAFHAGAVHDIGTCYSVTFAYGTSNRWMRQLGIEQVPLGIQFMDDQPLMRFVADGSYAQFGKELVRYVSLLRSFATAVRERGDDPDVKEMCARPIEAWLEDHQLPRIRRAMLRAVTSMGYGFLSEVPTCQTLRWCTLALFLSGAVGQVKFPVGGWQGFWERFSLELDIRLGEEVRRIERHKGRITVNTVGGEGHFDHVVVTCPLDDLARIMDLTDEERFLASAIEWGGYTSTLVDVENWFTNCNSLAFSRSLENPADRGRLLGARRSGDPPPPDGPAKSYICAQYSGSWSSAALADMLTADIEQNGGKPLSVVEQRHWKYCPRYQPDAIREGLLGRMQAIQGRNNTWFSGSSFSYESVSNIVEFNRELSSAIRGRLS